MNDRPILIGFAHWFHRYIIIAHYGEIRLLLDLFIGHTVFFHAATLAIKFCFLFVDAEPQKTQNRTLTLLPHKKYPISLFVRINGNEWIWLYDHPKNTILMTYSVFFLFILFINGIPRTKIKNNSDWWGFLIDFNCVPIKNEYQHKFCRKKKCLEFLICTHSKLLYSTSNSNFNHWYKIWFRKQKKKNTSFWRIKRWMPTDAKPFHNNIQIFQWYEKWFILIQFIYLVVFHQYRNIVRFP